MKTEEKLLIGGTVVVVALALIRQPNGKTVLQNATDTVSSSVGASIGSAPSSFIGGVSSAFATTSQVVGQDLASQEVALLPDPLLKIQRWVFQQLPDLFSVMHA